jgi:hypothetical protein
MRPTQASKSLAAIPDSGQCLDDHQHTEPWLAEDHQEQRHGEHREERAGRQQQRPASNAIGQYAKQGDQHHQHKHADRVRPQAGRMSWCGCYRWSMKAAGRPGMHFVPAKSSWCLVWPFRQFLACSRQSRNMPNKPAGRTRRSRYP